ncbi:MAG: SusC/RagA family TonB-linked outer membrane protein [Gemmatimonadaceae bacterium]
MPNCVWRVVVAAAALAVAPRIAATQGATTVAGKVVRADQQPVANVQVFVRQLGVGGTTQSDGSYSFTVPAAQARGQTVTLTARGIGYRETSASIVLGPGRVTQDFTVAAAPVQLSQIVVTGAGTQAAAATLPNRIDRVETQDIVKANEPNLAEALAAKAPNLQVTSQSGDPGSSVSVMIRGITTLTGDGQPLWVVDGIPLDNSTNTIDANNAGVVSPNRISDVNPNDVESIEILKGAAAAAIYGSRAGQGVILVTTKSGHAGATRYSLRSGYSWDDVTQGYPMQRIYGQGSGGVAQVCTTPDCVGARFSWGARLPAGTPTYEHFKEIFRTGHLADNNISISGGDERRTFYLSGGQSDHHGFVIGPNNEYKRTTARLKASQELTNQLRVAGNFSYVDTRGRFIQRGNNVSGLMLGSLRTPPEFNNANYLDPKSGLHRSYRFPNPTLASLTRTRGFDNPFFVANEEAATSNLGRAFGNVDVVYDPAEWLTVKYTAGADYAGDDRLEIFPFTSSSFPTGQVVKANFVNYVLDHNLLAILRRQFSTNLGTELTVGQNLNSSNLRQNFNTGYNLIAPQPFHLTNTINVVPNDYESLIHRESYFAQLRVDFYDQLSLTVAGRNDGSSTFAQNDRRHFYPKYGAAWQVNKAFNPFGDALDFAKLRVAYGETGKEPDVYSTLDKYSIGQFFEYGGQFLRTALNGRGGLVSPFTPGQSKLRPETTRETEYGIDFALFGGLADFSFSGYNKQSINVIFSVPVPSSSGYTSQVQNGGTIANTGVEAQLNLHPLRNNTFSWDLGLLYSQNNNLVKSLTGTQEVVVGSGNFGQSVAKPGYPVGAIEGPDFARCRYGETNMVNGFDINALCRKTNAPNGALFIDDGSVSGDPTGKGFPLVDETLRILGTYEPRWQGAVRNVFTFGKRFEISSLVDIKYGGRAWDGTRGALNVYGTHRDTEIRDQKRVFGPAKGGTPGYWEPVVAGPGVGTVVTIDQDWFQGDGGAFSDQISAFVEDAGYVKLREVSLAYTLDQPFMKSWGLSSIQLRLAGRNLKTWTDYKGIDPESNLAGASGFIQGFDWFNNPQTRSIVLSVGLNR